MPSEDIGSPNTDYMERKPRSFGNISQPFLSETYRCVAPYETKDTKNRPFSVAVNETVDVLIKDKGGMHLTVVLDGYKHWVKQPDYHIFTTVVPYIERNGIEICNSGKLEFGNSF